jgi:hypothetical protein
MDFKGKTSDEMKQELLNVSIDDSNDHEDVGYSASEPKQEEVRPIESFKRGNGNGNTPGNGQGEVNIRMYRDVEELKDKYGSGPVDRLAKDFLLGKIEMPEGLEEDERPPHEALLIKNYVDNLGKKIRSDDIKEFVNNANEGPRLKSRSQEHLAPETIRPTRPRVKKPEKRFKFPEVTPDDMKEIMQILYERHPERFEE